MRWGGDMDTKLPQTQEERRWFYIAQAAKLAKVAAELHDHPHVDDLLAAMAAWVKLAEELEQKIKNTPNNAN